MSLPKSHWATTLVTRTINLLAKLDEGATKKRDNITLAPLTTAASVISLNVELVVKILVGDKIIFQSNVASRLESKGLWMFKIKSEIPEECCIVAIHITDLSDNNVSVFHFKPVEVEPGAVITKADKDRCFLHSMQIVLLDDSELSFQLKAGFEI
ncbi:hypothetical protein M422DRAFT_247291 [Sphaerobolus stellatus SS14]|nr:hypothetical protein M422DRAFT_247291 [Sphaerobolus stellatus SS14]